MDINFMIFSFEKDVEIVDVCCEVSIGPVDKMNNM